MKNKMKHWLLLFFVTVFSLSFWGCGDITTGDAELDQAIVDLVVEGVDSALDSYLGEESGEDAGQGDTLPENAITPTLEPTATTVPQETATPSLEPTATATPSPTVTPKPTATNTPAPTATSTPVPTETPTSTLEPTATPVPTKAPESVIDEDGWYYSKEDVALYIYTYGTLPDNFITKNEARELGWEGGSVERYKDGAAIGGDKFGNYEGLLPKKNGRKYYECDIDTNGKSSRGAKRIIFSNDGLIYYTSDHYESFELLYGEE